MQSPLKPMSKTVSQVFSVATFSACYSLKVSLTCRCFRWQTWVTFAWHYGGLSKNFRVREGEAEKRQSRVSEHRNPADPSGGFGTCCGHFCPLHWEGSAKNRERKERLACGAPTCVHDCDCLLGEEGPRALDCLRAQVEAVAHAGVEVFQGEGGLVGQEFRQLRGAQLIGVVDCAEERPLFFFAFSEVRRRTHDTRHRFQHAKPVFPAHLADTSACIPPDARYSAAGGPIPG